MKKKTLIAAVIVSCSVLATSCLKDGMNDFEGLNHPMQLQGTFNPNLGVPVGSADITLSDLMSSFNPDADLLQIDTTNDMVTLTYDTTMHSNFTFDDEQSTKYMHHKSGRFLMNPRAVKGYSYTPKTASDTTGIHHEHFGDSIVLNLFDMMSSLPANFQVKNANANLSAFVKAHVNARTHEMLTRYGLHAYIDSLSLTAVNSNGATFSLPISQTAFYVNDLVAGQNIDLLENADLAGLINVKPDKILYSGRLTVLVSHEFFGMDLSSFMADSLGIDSIGVDSHLNLKFPLSVSFEDLAYDTEIKIGNNVDIKDLQLDSSALILELENGLPLRLALNANFVDSLGNTTASLFDADEVVIDGGKLSYSSSTDTYVVNTPTTTVLRAPLNTERMNALLHAKTLAIHAKVATSSNLDNAKTQPIVSLLGSDSLHIRLYAQVHPRLTVNIPLTSK